MAVKGKKLKQRIGRWQEYVEQPPSLPVHAGEHGQSPPRAGSDSMFEWSALTSDTSSEFCGDADSSLVSLDSGTFRSNALDIEWSAQSTSLQTNADAAEDRRRIEAFEHLLNDLQIQLQNERMRADQLQSQLAREVMHSRQVRVEQRSKPALQRLDIAHRIDGLKQQARHLTGPRKTSGHYTSTVTKSRINSVKWILMVAVTAGIWGLLVSVIGDSLLH